MQTDLQALRSRVDFRLYEAYRLGRGIRLTADDVEELLADEAIQCGISNVLSGHAALAADTRLFPGRMAPAEYRRAVQAEEK